MSVSRHVGDYIAACREIPASSSASGGYHSVARLTQRGKVERMHLAVKHPGIRWACAEFIVALYTKATAAICPTSTELWGQFLHHTSNA